jgi:hypothetical protein
VAENQFNEFEQAFREACAEVKVPDGQEQIGLGASAVNEVFSFAKNQLAQASAVNPYFAGRDLDHPIRLAHLAGKLFQGSLVSGEAVRSGMSVSTLVLIFSSLLLHDIGMSLLDPETTDEMQMDEL